MPEQRIASKKEVFHKYIDEGYILAPIRGKGPPQKGWRHRRYDPFASIDDFPNNFAILLQEDDLVIDIDPRHFVDGKNSALQLTKDINNNLITFTVKTGGGGLHLYFKKPPETKIRGSLPEYPGMEFKSVGKYVVGAGCVHPETHKLYKVNSGQIEDKKTAPLPLLQLLERGPVDDEILGQGLKAFKNDEQSVKRFEEYLVTAPVAIEGEGGDAQTFKIACRGRDFGLSSMVTFDVMYGVWNTKCKPPWGFEDLAQKVKNAYLYNEAPAGLKHPESDFIEVEQKKKFYWDKTENGQWKKTLSNLVNFFTGYDKILSDLLKFSCFTQDIEFKRHAVWHNDSEMLVPWGDTDAVHCKFHLSSTKGFELGTNIIHEAALVAANLDRYHPVKDYLKSLKWDEVCRVGHWLSIYAGADNTLYTRTVGEKTLLAAVARIMDPGCKFDYILVLEGEQGTGKSTLCNILGGAWYGDLVLNMHDRDTIDAMRNKWIIEVSEMECTKRSETQAMKAFLTRQVDRVRLAYARSARDFPRQCIFIGTINPETDAGYLKDTTGNRRFWPVHTRAIDLTLVKKDRDQLWAECFMMYKKGVQLYITSLEVEAEASKEADKRRSKDPWLPKIKLWINTPDEKGEYRSFVSALDVYEDCIGGVARSFSRIEQTRISSIMTLDMRWDKKVKYVKETGDNTRGYERPQYDERLL